MKIVVPTLFIAFCIACTPKQKHIEPDSFDKEKVTQEIKETLKNYFDDMNNEGLLSEFKYLDSSEDFFWVPPGFNKRLNYAETRSVIEDNAPQMLNIDNQWKSIEIHALSNNFATYTGVVSAKYNDTANMPHNYELIETGVLIKRGDNWKILCGQTAQLPKEN